MKPINTPEGLSSSSRESKNPDVEENEGEEEKHEIDEEKALIECRLQEDGLKVQKQILKLNLMAKHSFIQNKKTIISRFMESALFQIIIC